MTLGRILVAVDDTPAALHAARAAVDLAPTQAAHVRFVHVLTDGELARHFAAAHRATRHNSGLQARRASGAASLLAHVAAVARRAQVPAETLDLQGDPASVILDEAASWPADLVVLGRSRARGAGHSFLGPVARHVLEFSEVPVLVVPDGRP